MLLLGNASLNDSVYSTAYPEEVPGQGPPLQLPVCAVLLYSGQRSLCLVQLLLCWTFTSLRYGTEETQWIQVKHHFMSIPIVLLIPLLLYAVFQAFKFAAYISKVVILSKHGRSISI